LALVLDNLQQLQHQQLLNEVAIREHVEISSEEFDRLYALYEAMRRNDGIDIESAVRDENFRHLERQVLILTRHLHSLQEKEAYYGIDAPAHIKIQIEDYAEKLDDAVRALHQLLKERSEDID
jgi:hypothetical protein